jgi:hypothetical protein
VVLARRVENEPTWDASEEIVALFTFIVDAVIDENVAEFVKSDDSCAESPSSVDIFPMFITVIVENCDEFPFIDEIVSRGTFTYGVDQYVPPRPSAVRTNELGITALLVPRANTVRKVILSESSVLRALADI